MYTVSFFLCQMCLIPKITYSPRNHDNKIFSIMNLKIRLNQIIRQEKSLWNSNLQHVSFFILKLKQKSNWKLLRENEL